MAIHGIVSTYFGDYEFDIGKSLMWTKTFCDSMYVMDVNLAESSRRYVVDWSYTFPNVKHSFFSKYSFFTDATSAKNWRKESFNRAKLAWNYDPDDWVMFIDGTEALNVFHNPPVFLTVTSAETIDIDENSGFIIFTTEEEHGAEVGDTLEVLGAQITTVIDDVPSVVYLDGKYLVDDVPTSTSIKVIDIGMALDIPDTALDSEALGRLTTEPEGFFEGDIFNSWIESEINAAIADGKNFISLDGWALIRSSSPEEVSFDVVSIGEGAVSTTSAARCEEYYVPMGNLIRIGKVSSFNNPAFNWLTLDQPAESFEIARPATNLSLISYAYVRWSDDPKRMTQSVSPDDPFYVMPNDEENPALRPVSEEDDLGFVMRTLISRVRPLDDVPLVWGDPDPVGEQPMVGIHQKLDIQYIPADQYSDGVFTQIGYNAFGGTPLYPGVLRSNLREGIWYTQQGSPPIRLKVVSGSLTDGLATITTAKPHYITAGTTVIIYGTDTTFDGTHVVTSIPTSTSFTFDRPTDLGDVASTSYPIGQAVTSPGTYGPTPWNYLTNTFGIDDPSKRFTVGVITTPL